LTELYSGEWTGYYEQGGSRHAQKMTLELADGVVRGDGVDGIGGFTMEGEYRFVDGAVRIGWIKTYDRAHSILYRGVLDATGSIVGTWEISRSWSGDFAIKPVPRVDLVHSTRKGSSG
jgi:hypothetical protein